MTLEKILQSQGFGSRKLCRALIKNGHVKVDGKTCIKPDMDLLPDNLVFQVHEEDWLYRQYVYLAMNKPAGFECSRQPQHHTSVFSLLLPQLLQRGVQCVGRLDQDTSGLLLFSDDGRFIHTYTSPKKKVPKIYEVRAKHPIQPEQIQLLQSGVQLHDEPAPIAALSCRQTEEYKLEMAISEGKYHQVKRMIAASGNRVENLHRSTIGGLVLDELLPSGQWRWLEKEDLIKLQYSAPQGLSP